MSQDAFHATGLSRATPDFNAYAARPYLTRAGRPHFPASVLGWIESQDEKHLAEARLTPHARSGRLRSPASVIGRIETQDE